MPRLRTIALSILVVSAGVSAGPAMLSAVVSASQQAASKPTPASVAGVSRERLKRLDAALQEHVDQNRVAGVVVLVLRDGKPVYERAVGWSDKEAESPDDDRHDLPHRVADQGDHERGDPGADGGRAASRRRSREPLHPRVRQDDGGGARATPASPRCRRDGRSRSRSADAHGRHLVRHRQPGRGRATRPRAWGRRPGSAGTPPTRTKAICDTMERLATLPFVAQPGEA